MKLDTSDNRPETIGIVGSGFSGVCTALHMLRNAVENPPAKPTTTPVIRNDQPSSLALYCSLL